MSESKYTAIMEKYQKQIEKIQAECEAEKRKLADTDIKKLTKGLMDAAEAFSALRLNDIAVDFKDETLRPLLVTLGLAVKSGSGKPKAGGGKGGARPGRKIKEAVKGGKTTFAEIAADKGLTEAEVKAYVEAKPKEFTVKGDKVSLAK